eukprot:scaffold27506_cov45-Cyclotella_meneghiniana.AAC.1
MAIYSQFLHGPTALKCCRNSTSNSNQQTNKSTLITNNKKSCSGAGAGKSTAVEVAQHFCFEFTRAVGHHWDETTFLYTATTGCAASLYRGVTLHSADFLNQHIDKISEESMKQWDN